MFTVAITVMVFMLIKVVPVFAEMYDGGSNFTNAYSSNYDSK